GDLTLDPIVDELRSAQSKVPEAANDETPYTEPANDNGLARFWPFAGIAIAAAVAFFVFLPTSAPATMITTSPGETREVAVSDAITMTLNGDSKVELKKDETRVAIFRGEVAFEIESDEPSPLRVAVAGLQLTDYGTVFNVALTDESVRIAVAEGVVGINPDTQAIRVPAGEAVEKPFSEKSFDGSKVARETVATWREGRLEFDATTAADAVAMLERSTGAKIELARALENRRLTGSLIIAEDRAVTIAELAAFFEASARKQSAVGQQEVWLIE
ncbi:MAG: FecR domain-containing protein, partial [Pseudomonadota bacterium]